MLCGPDEEFAHIAQCRGLVTNVVITGYYAKPDQVSKTETMARGTEVLLVATSDPAPQSSNKEEITGCQNFGSPGLPYGSVLLTWSGWRIFSDYYHMLCGQSNLRTCVPITLVTAHISFVYRSCRMVLPFYLVP